MSGGAAINVLARQHGLALTVVDAGVRGDPMGGSTGPSASAAGVSLLRHRVGDGTRDFRYLPAMTPEQCNTAILAGRSIARSLLSGGCNVLLLGEMGIGNTASAAVLLHRLVGWPLQSCVGRGTGLDDEGLAYKLRVLVDASTRCPGPLAPLAALTEFGGFEIAMLVGAILEAATRPCVIVIDGFTVSVAALLAAQLQPEVPGRCVFSHCSAEHAHRRLLEHLGATPLLDLSMRLGEGSGAAMAYPLLESSVRLLVEMASFESAGVSGHGA
jgi:nicotinate-nucleotide--dimethylbenzimidazole phosphoribosyltransferase